MDTFSPGTILFSYDYTEGEVCYLDWKLGENDNHDDNRIHPKLG